ncbi:MAG: nucleoside deaminase [Alphaproteobacteria bacterium]|nr:nucleoside deaminase [Alphaproteobacteria bacterium]
MDKNKFMKRAIEIAEKNITDSLGGPFGAVIVKKGIIIGEGSNTVTSTNDPTAHAEINAIRQACQNSQSFNLSNSIIYTNCEPCPMCLSAIYWARIEKIFFANSKTDAAEIGFDDDLIYQEIILPVEKRSIPTQQIFIDESILAFRAWERSDSKINY